MLRNLYINKAESYVHMTNEIDLNSAIILFNNFFEIRFAGLSQLFVLRKLLVMLQPISFLRLAILVWSSIDRPS